MTTYKTIKAAFENGTGDVFFTKNAEFIAVSRKDDQASFEKMEVEGWNWLSYQEVMALAKEQEPAGEVAEKATPQRLEEMAASFRGANVDNISNGRNGYYDEFPDAYNQNL